MTEFEESECKEINEWWKKTYKRIEEIFETDWSYSTQVPLTRAEIIESLSSLRNGKACGPDSIPGELLKYGGEAVNELTHKMFDRMWGKI